MNDNPISSRLSALDTKAYYLLVALSFLYLKNPTGGTVALALKAALTLTAVGAVTPLQDLSSTNWWLEMLRWLKVSCLWCALGCTLWWVWSVA